MLNVIAFWNAIYMQAVAENLQAILMPLAGAEMKDSIVLEIYLFAIYIIHIKNIRRIFVGVQSNVFIAINVQV